MKAETKRPTPRWRHDVARQAPTLRRWKMCSAVLLVVALFACGQKPEVKAPEPPKPPSEPLAWIPDSSSVMGRVVLSPWQKTPLWSLWESRPAEQNRWAELVDVTLIDELAAGGRSDGPENRTFVAALKGRFGAGYLEGRAKAKSLLPEVKAPLSFYTLGETRWAQVLPELLVVCSPDQMDAVVARLGAGPDARVKGGALYQALATRVSFDQADLAIIAEDTTGAGKEALKRRGAQLGLGNLADDVTRAGFSVDLGTNVALAAAAETPDGARAEGLRQSVDETLDTLQRNLFVGMLGLRPLVAALKPATDGSFVVVRGAVPEAEMQALFAKAASMLEIAAQQGQAGLMLPGL